MEAVKQLGHDLVEANILPLSSEEAELAEIDENLVRKDLSYLEQGQLIKRRDDILTVMGLRAPAHRPSQEKGSPNDHLIKTTDDLAAEIGLKRTAVKDRKRVATSITQEVQEALIDTPVADMAGELQTLARKAPEQQKEIAEIITSGQAATVSEAISALSLELPSL